MRPLLTATFAAAAVLASGCAATTPTVGTIASCGPGLDAAACRTIAQVALSAYQGPALSADNIAVDVWASCVLAQVAEAAKDGTTCYSVTALLGTSGGRRVAEGTYEGGTPVNIDGLVWLDGSGTLHAVTNAESAAQ